LPESLARLMRLIYVSALPKFTYYKKLRPDWSIYLPHIISYC
jgi:hypothetical protein